MRPVFFAFAISFSSGLCIAATIHVPADYPAIQQGIDAASDWDTVLVAPGTYVENIDFKGKTITVISSDGPAVTIIDGGTPVHPDYGSVVTFQTGEGENSVLDGFTLTKGMGTLVYSGCGYSVVTGGGVCCDGASPSVCNNRIIGNNIGGGSVLGLGGGIYCGDNSHPLISSNIIEENSADDYSHGGRGGGISCEDGAYPIIRYNVISNNAAGTGGGIMCISSGWVHIQSNEIANNEAYMTGGGIHVYDGDAAMTNNLVWGNTAENHSGGGITLEDTLSAVINNTIVGNDAYEIGGGLHIGIGSSVILSNLILWDNTSPSGSQLSVGDTSWFPSICTLGHSDLQGGSSMVYVAPGCHVNWEPGIIDSDPVFVNQSDGDFHLTYMSPCRDGGDNNAPMITSLDFENNPRTAYGHADMGADEFHTHLYCTGDPTPGGDIGLTFIDTPNTMPIMLWLGSGVLETPIHLKDYGHWYLEFPILLTLKLGPVPGPAGVLVLPHTIPASVPAPMRLSLQSLHGNKLSNLCVVWIE